jgi:hypothetical protein
MDILNLGKPLNSENHELDNISYFDNDSDLQALSNKNNKANNINLANTAKNEFSSEIEEGVEYRPSSNVLEERSLSLGQQEQERIQKLRQKEVLINLQKNINKGNNYSRNMDESAVLNTNKKNINPDEKEEIKNKIKYISKDDEYAEAIYIGSASEEFYEEFLNHQQKNTKYQTKENQENKKKKNNDDKNDKKEKLQYYSFEDDEIIDIDLNILESAEYLDKKNKVSNKEIEKRIGLIDLFTKRNTNKKQQNNKNPALEKALKKETAHSPGNKLKKKFSKK